MTIISTYPGGWARFTDPSGRKWTWAYRMVRCGTCGSVVHEVWQDDLHRELRPCCHRFALHQPVADVIWLSHAVTASSGPYDEIGNLWLNHLDQKLWLDHP